MKTFNRICIKDFIIVDQKSGETFKLQRGKEYTTSDVYKDNLITVFSGMWCHNIPVDLFAGEMGFTNG
jgi:hypothetical protein